MPRSGTEQHRSISLERREASSLVGSLVEVDISGNAKNEPSRSAAAAAAVTSSNGRQRRQRRRRRSIDHPTNHPDVSNETNILLRQSRKQMIESLVRFSYHTPRAVLEDLIRHEMKVCRQQREEVVDIRENEENDQDGKDSDDDESLSSLSSGEHPDLKLTGSIDMADIMVMDDGKNAKTHSLPDNEERESALVFIDISGFTKLSTMLDEETLSSVINSYFEMIVGEVNAYGGDVLKFAGDALFVEWRVPKKNGGIEKRADSSSSNSNVLKDLNSTLSSMNTDDDLSAASGLAAAVLKASRCAAVIVRKYSDYDVTVPNCHVSGSVGVLNVHCGIGAGILTGIHASDYTYQEEEDMVEEENVVESRREYLFLGDAIDQVAYWLILLTLTF
jgi:hypothetical protein